MLDAVLLGEGFQRGRMVAAADDLGVQGFEMGEHALEAGDFLRSGAGERRTKCEDHGALGGEVVELDLLAAGAGA